MNILPQILPKQMQNLKKKNPSSSIEFQKSKHRRIHMNSHNSPKLINYKTESVNQTDRRSEREMLTWGSNMMSDSDQQRFLTGNDGNRTSIASDDRKGERKRDEVGIDRQTSNARCEMSIWWWRRLRPKRDVNNVQSEDPKEVWRRRIDGFWGQKYVIETPFSLSPPRSGVGRGLRFAPPHVEKRLSLTSHPHLKFRSSFCRISSSRA